jgi:hypothetical protein
MAGLWLGRQETLAAAAAQGGAAVTIIARVPKRLRSAALSFKELLQSWRATAGEPRTAAQYLVRLPLDDAARLGALAEMFPGRTPEQLITDLLGVALAELGTAMPYIQGEKVISTDEQGDPVYEDTGLTPRFMDLTRRNRRKLETELKKAT